MSDLISRSEVVKLVNQFVFGLCKEQNDEVRKTFIKYIEKMPTAYDIDKVINQLGDYGNEEMDYYQGTPYANCIRECVSKAIEIVKQGGAPDDACEWKYNDTEYYWESSCDHLHIFMADGPKENEYSFCPYCGKKIKAVE